MAGGATPLVAISRTELALRTAKFAALKPVTHSFDLSDFKGAVAAEATRLAKAPRNHHQRPHAKTTLSLDEQLMRVADRARPLAIPDAHSRSTQAKLGLATARGAGAGGDGGAPGRRGSTSSSTLRILPIHSHLVRHGTLIARCIQKHRPQRLAVPSGMNALFSFMLADKTLAKHALRQYSSEAAYRAAERDLILHCKTEFGLSGVVDRRLLHRIAPKRAPGLSGRRAWDYAAERVRYLPVFAGAFQAFKYKVPVEFLGIPPELFEERARDKTLAVEWEMKEGLEDFLVDSGVPFAEFYTELVKRKQAQLTPQELLSDLNMRHVVYNIAQHPTPGTTLLVVPATEYHLVVGWLAAAKALTTTAVNETLDPALDIVPSLEKAAKHPEFLEVERAIHVDTNPSAVAGGAAELDLTQDPRLARAFGEHNPMVRETLRASPAIRVLSPPAAGGEDGALTYEQTTIDGRSALNPDVDSIL